MAGGAGILNPSLGGAIDGIHFCLYYGGTTLSYQCPAEKAFFVKTQIPYNLAITKVGVRVMTAGSAGAVIEVGVYDSAGSKLGSAEIDATAMGVRTANLSLSLAAGVYWIAWVLNDVTTRPVTEYDDIWAYRVAGIMGYANSNYPLPASIPSLGDEDIVMPVVLFND